MESSGAQHGLVRGIMDEVTNRAQNIFGSHLRRIILFGSYARGEQEPYSDMDIMILVNLNEEELKGYDAALVKIMTDISLQYGVLPTIIDKNYDHFYRWIPYLPFYQNVQAEGIEFYAS